MRRRAVLATQTSSQSASPGIIAACDDFALRWQSVAATPLWYGQQWRRKRRGALLPAAVQNIWLQLRRAALYRGFSIRRRATPTSALELATRCRLEVGDTAGWKPALRAVGRREAFDFSHFGFRLDCGIRI